MFFSPADSQNQLFTLQNAGPTLAQLNSPPNDQDLTETTLRHAPLSTQPACPLLSLSCLACPVLPCHVLSVMSCPVLSCPVLSCSVLSCSVLSCSVLSCSVLSCSVLSCSVLSCSVLSCRPVLFVMSYPDMFCPPCFKRSPFFFVLFTADSALGSGSGSGSDVCLLKN